METPPENTNIYCKFKAKLQKLKEKTYRVGIYNLLLIIISSGSISLVVYSLWAQAKLKDSMEMQAAQINELIKTKKDIYFSQNAADDKNYIAIKELAGLVEELVKYKNEAVIPAQPVLGNATESAKQEYSGMVMVKKDLTDVSIFQDMTPTSAVISTAKAGEFLFYYQKQAGWYQVEKDIGKLGWIQEEMVNDI